MLWTFGKFCQKFHRWRKLLKKRHPKNNNILIFGPNKFSSQLETSKLFARNIMERYNIPQPAFFECETEEEIYSVSNQINLPVVLKADGIIQAQKMVKQ